MPNQKIGYRPTWAEVNLDNLVYNFKQIKKILKPGIKVMACVKADAYGHGLIPVALKLAACGADYLGVASIDEGIKLRQARVNFPILILGLIMKEDSQALFKYNLIPTVCSFDLAATLNKSAARYGKVLDIHVKVDTGMGRIGITHEEALGLIKKIHKLKNLNIQGLFTHFAFADLDADFTNKQIKLFTDLINNLKKLNINIPLVHAANSMGIIAYKNSHFNMVRPGLILYGLYPREGLRIKLKPVLVLKTKIIYVKRMPKGSGISYGHIYTTKKDTRIATLPIGYGDGYPRNLSNLAPVLIANRIFKISGRVCMDQIMVDVAGAKVRIGNEVVLIGKQGRNKITVERIAALAGTIPYEITCGLGSRIPRIYI